MNEMIVIKPKQIGNEEVNAVDARELHSNLVVKKDFTSWMKQNVNKLSLIEGVDYLLTQKGEQTPSGTKYRSEYIISLDAAKHISMMAGTEKAHEVRTYFIEFEKNHKNTLANFSNDPFIQLRMKQIEAEKRIDLLEHKVDLFTPTLSSGAMFRITGMISSIAKLYRRMQEIKRVNITHSAAQNYITSITLEKFEISDIAFVKDVNSVTRFLQDIGKRYQAEYDKWFNQHNLFA